MFKMFCTTIRGWQTTLLEANMAFCLPTFVNKVLLIHRAYSVLSAAISCLGGGVKQLQVRPCELQAFNIYSLSQKMLAGLCHT